MPITANELPDLVAAAVRKAVNEKQITDENLAAIAHHPITLGLIPSPLVKPVLESAAPAGSAAGSFRQITTMGYVMNGLNSLLHPDTLRAAAEVKPEE